MTNPKQSYPCPHARPSWQSCPHCLGINDRSHPISPTVQELLDKEASGGTLADAYAKAEKVSVGIDFATGPSFTSVNLPDGVYLVRNQRLVKLAMTEDEIRMQAQLEAAQQKIHQLEGQVKVLSVSSMCSHCHDELERLRAEVEALRRNNGTDASG